jgi:hypothetical protein
MNPVLEVIAEALDMTIPVATRSTIELRISSRRFGTGFQEGYTGRKMQPDLDVTRLVSAE